MKLQNYGLRNWWDSDLTTVYAAGYFDINLEFVESCAKLIPIQSYEYVDNIIKMPWYLPDQNKSYEKYIGEYQLYRWRMRSGKEYLFKECIDIDSKGVR